MLIERQDISCVEEPETLFGEQLAYHKTKPFVKWPGGKERELPMISKHLPSSINRYFEPFVGGGAVYHQIQAKEYSINDLSIELINLYKSLRSGNTGFFESLRGFALAWDRLGAMSMKDAVAQLRQPQSLDYSELINQLTSNSSWPRQANGYYLDLFLFFVQKKVERIKDSELKREQELSTIDIQKNVECALKGALYYLSRSVYNTLPIYSPSRTFHFYIMRQLSFTGMFRFTKSGKFNVPYGGIGYNSRNFHDAIRQMSDFDLVSKLVNTRINCQDFEEYLRNQEVTKSDFMFFDPPYDSVFSEYSQADFSKQDQIRFFNSLKSLNCKWMAVVQATPLVVNLLKSMDVSTIYYEKSYQASFMNRNERDVEHVLIKNY